MEPQSQGILRTLQSPPASAGTLPIRHQTHGGSGLQEASLPVLGVSPGRLRNTEPEQGPAGALERGSLGSARFLQGLCCPNTHFAPPGSRRSEHSCPGATHCQAPTTCGLGTQRHARHRPALEKLGWAPRRETEKYPAIRIQQKRSTQRYG